VIFFAERSVTLSPIPSGSGGLGICQMKNYSIVRIGNEYVVQADEKSVLKIASRRRAARLVTDAAELLDSQPAAPLPADVDAEPSIDREPATTPDPQDTPDLLTAPDPSEAP
jgi:hypothetical protein